jgi:hypothetical protein
MLIRVTRAAGLLHKADTKDGSIQKSCHEIHQDESPETKSEGKIHKNSEIHKSIETRMKTRNKKYKGFQGCDRIG